MLYSPILRYSHSFNKSRYLFRRGTNNNTCIARSTKTKWDWRLSFDGDSLILHSFRHSFDRSSLKIQYWTSRCAALVGVVRRHTGTHNPFDLVRVTMKTVKLFLIVVPKIRETKNDKRRTRTTSIIIDIDSGVTFFE